MNRFEAGDQLAEERHFEAAGELLKALEPEEEGEKSWPEVLRDLYQEVV